MSYFAFSSLLNFISSALVGIFALIGNPRARTNQIFAFFSFAVAGWAWFYYMWQMADAHDEALFHTKVLHQFAIWIFPGFLHFICLFTNQFRKYKFWVIWAYTFCVVFVFVGNSPIFIPEVYSISGFKYWPKAGPAYVFYVIEYFLISCLSLKIILEQMRITTGKQYVQFKLLFIGILIGLLGGATNFPLFYGIPIVPYGNVLVAVYAVMSIIAIIRYQLMDIQIIIKRSLIYSTLVALILVFYTMLVLVFEKYTQGIFNYNSLLLTFVITVLFGVGLVPLRNFMQRLIDRWFFKATPTEIAEQNELLRSEVAEKERFKAVATLASGIAHDVRNPLTAIKTFFDYYERKKNDPEFMEKFAKLSASEVKRIELLVQKLMDFAKPTSPVLQKVHVHTLIDDTLSLLHAKLRDGKINVIKNYESEDIALFLDANQMKQVMMNLILNAIEAMPKGGTLTVKTELCRERSRPFPTVLIIISDTGIGIPKNNLNKIFDAFYTSKETGTGLGLSICKDIIEKHHGKISVESEVGKGTTFVVSFPLEG